MREWRELAERLVELDFAIEDLSSWATKPDDVATLTRLERLRDEVQAALAHHQIPDGLRRRLGEHDASRRTSAAAIDPRD